MKFFKVKGYELAGFFAVLLIVIIGLIAGIKFNEFAKLELLRNGEMTSISIANYINGILQEADNTVSVLAKSPNVVSFFEGESSKYLGVVNEILDRFSEETASICYLLNTQGLAIASSNRNSPESFIGYDYGFRSYFKKALKGEKAFCFALGVTSKERGYYTSAPIKDVTGKIVGVAVIKRKLDSVGKYLRKFKECFFVDEHGIIFLSSSPKYLFRTIYPLTDEEKKKIIASKQFGEGQFEPIFAHSLNSGDIITLAHSSMLVTTIPVGDYGWSIILLQSTHDIFVHRLLIIIPVIILILLVVGFIFYLKQKDKFLQNLKRSELRYSSIFETGPQVMIVFDLNGKIIACSRRIGDMLGYSVSETVGCLGLEFAHPDDKEKVRELLERVKEEGEVKDFIIRVMHKNGSLRNISMSATLMPGQTESDFASVVCVLEDVTLRLQNENKLRESKEQYRKIAKEYRLTQEATLNILEDLQDAKDSIETDRRGFLNIIENSWDGIIIVDDLGVVRFVNRSAQRIFDAEREDLVGKPFAHAINADEVGRIRIQQKDGKSCLVEIRAGKTEWMHQNMNLVVLHDITEQEEVKTLLLRAAEEWRRTFDAIGDGVALLNTQGHVLRCNNAAAKIFKKPFPDVIGLNCHYFFHGDNPDAECVIAQTLKSKKRSTRIKLKDNRWYLLSANPILREGDVSEIVYTMSDMTEQKNIEHKLKEYTEYVESIVETAQAVIVVLDRELKIKSINKFAEDLLGYKREEVIGSGWVNLFVSRAYKEEINQVFQNCFEGERVKGYEIPIISKDGKESVISWYSAELRDGEGKIIGVVTMGYDVSQRKEMEKVQRLAQLGTLVSHMAHEVNNPLMVISGRVQLSLMEDIQNPEIKENLEVTLKECKRAKDIIQRLLRFSRPSKGELKEVDISKSIEEVVSLVEHQFKLDNVSISVDVPPYLPLVKGDEKQLHEVFMNLLTNAQDAIEGDGEIKIEAKVKDDFIKITFKDTGVGISKKVLDKIFDPFFTTKKKGTGLGLAICYGIIKAHNGKMMFQSVEGKGTSAIILLPILKEGNNV